MRYGSNETRPPVAGERARANRLIDAALRVGVVETTYALDRTARGAEAAKRELADAAFDYLARHWDGYIPAADRGPGVLVAIAAALDEYRHDERTA